MIIVDKEQFLKQKKQFVQKLLHENFIFVYPTDTIYGIGCNANDEEAVQRIRALKEREQNPFSIIAPSKEWIAEHCIVHPNGYPWIKRLPGRYTLLFKIKKKDFADSINPNSDVIGIRIPDNWFSDLVPEFGVPIVSTSANLTGKPHMTSLENLPDSIKNGVDMIIYEGEKKANPSLIVDLSDPDEVKEIPR